MKIAKQKIKIKNLIGIIENPTPEDFLFEILDFLDSENRLTDDFTKYEVSLKTRCRINKTIEEDLKTLIELGFIKHLGWTKYKIIKHPWEN